MRNEISFSFDFSSRPDVEAPSASTPRNFRAKQHNPRLRNVQQAYPLRILRISFCGWPLALTRCFSQTLNDPVDFSLGNGRHRSFFLLCEKKRESTVVSKNLHVYRCRTLLRVPVLKALEILRPNSKDARFSTSRNHDS